jgi:hypothetical protein
VTQPPDFGWRCYKLDSVVDVARAAYYAARVLQLGEELAAAL